MRKRDEHSKKKKLLFLSGIIVPENRENNIEITSI